jgi:hypothetical protein
MAYDKIQTIKLCRELKSVLNKVPVEKYTVKNLCSDLIQIGFTYDQLNDFLKTGGGLKEAKDFVESVLEIYRVEHDNGYTWAFVGGASTEEEAFARVGRVSRYHKQERVRILHNGVIIAEITNFYPEIALERYLETKNERLI